MNPPSPEPLRSPTAEKDLKEVWASVAQRRGDEAADTVIDQIIAQARKHARFPLTGRSLEELYPGLRSFVSHPYIVFFRPVRDTIELVHILHHSRDIERIVRETLGTSESAEE
jgi:toxin ParE1/3/4